MAEPRLDEERLSRGSCVRACVVVPSLAHEEEELEQHAKKGL
jgi:hypothetical protein